MLDAAEEMFMEHGYAAITLRDLAERLDIRQASLYY
ncbi:MAG: helix-turn-helix domain-containing protein, partial [Chloroflexota bacterium]|nr:helix-turn-helix domain-containing protein [Chloroflexota bacterium]